MSVFMTGVMFGAFVMGTLADRIGRKRTLFICLTNMLILNTLSGLVPNYILHVVLRFLVGFFTAGYVLTSFVLVNELIGSSWRGIVGNVIQVDGIYIFLSFYPLISISRFFFSNLKCWISHPPVQASFAIGIMIYSIAGYFIRDWRTLTYVCTAVGLPLLLFVKYLPESPRWLQSKGNVFKLKIIYMIFSAKIRPVVYFYNSRSRPNP